MITITKDRFSHTNLQEDIYHFPIDLAHHYQQVTIKFSSKANFSVTQFPISTSLPTEIISVSNSSSKMEAEPRNNTSLRLVKLQICTRLFQYTNLQSHGDSDFHVQTTANFAWRLREIAIKITRHG